MNAEPSTTIAPIWHSLQDYLSGRKTSSIGVLTDENTLRHCYPLVKDALPDHVQLTVPAGELYKNLTTCERIWSWMTEEGFDRKSLLINLGGGVIGDMGGFCAATFKRGIKFIHVPTTLLAQVDASIGGKLGVDFHRLKNHLGTFQLPDAVLTDPVFLKTLPERELISGYAEVIKHCLIADPGAWNRLKGKKIEDIDLEDVIRHSIGIKSGIVEQDLREGGLRKILNFGHTLGHALESYYLNTSGEMLHGEAVAVGMILEALLSKKKFGLANDEYQEIEKTILLNFGYPDISGIDLTRVIRLARQDKKNENSEIRGILLEKIGMPVEAAITGEDIQWAIASYHAVKTERD